ncbi:MAG: hypothetical protein IPG93_16605 [Burkholderiales bacterium]|nr:hypothetical protein [Burkholderiales bacterium]
MILALLLAAQVVTSTSAKPKLTTLLEHALWSAYVTERTGRRAAERELAGTRLELVARSRRVERLETLTASIAAGRLLCPACPAVDCPMMTPIGALVCGGISVAVGAAGVAGGRSSCGINLLNVGVP